MFGRFHPALMSLFQQKASSTLVADAKISMTLRCACDKWTDKLAGNKYLTLFVHQRVGIANASRNDWSGPPTSDKSETLLFTYQKIQDPPLKRVENRRHPSSHGLCRHLLSTEQQLTFFRVGSSPNLELFYLKQYAGSFVHWLVPASKFTNTTRVVV